MENGTHMTWEEYGAYCPKHQTEEKAEYSFGKYGDAVVIVHTCNCCVVKINNPSSVSGDFEYYTNYKDAAARAQMAKQQLNAYYR